MTNRERVRMALDHREPDRIPLDLGSMVTSLCPETYVSLAQHLGLGVPSIEVDSGAHCVRNVDRRLLSILGVDVFSVFPPPLSNTPGCTSDGPNKWIDEWGTERIRDGVQTRITRAPLQDATLDDLKLHKWPDFSDPDRFVALGTRVEELYRDTDFALLAVVEGLGQVFERAWKMRGFSQFLTDLVLEPRFAEALMDIIVEVNLGFLKSYLEVVGPFVDVVQIGDDLGTQRGPLISPEVYRALIKPRHAVLIDYIKSKTNAKVFFHCCGAITAFIPDLIDIGVDILNPVQTSAVGMEPRKLKAAFGDVLSFWGAVDTQHLLPHATPGQVRDEVKRIVDELAPGGGYVLAPVHNVQGDVPCENIQAMYEAARDFGGY